MKIAVVGSNRGIGLALVEKLMKNGHEVLAFCRKASPELKDLQPAQIFENFEVTDLEKMTKQLAALENRSIDQLYHVSGILRSTSFDDFNVDAIKEQFEVNAIAPILSAKAFLPYLKPEAKIGLVTSRMGSIEDNTSGGSYGYRMSKTALNSAGKSLSEDLRQRGTAVFLLHPGWVKTDMTGNTGHVDTQESALGLIEIMDNKTLKETGSFWHMNGEPLPW